MTAKEEREKSAHLRLNKIGRDDLAPVTVEECQSSAEGRQRNTPDDALGDDSPPAGLRLVDSLLEEVVEKEGFKILFALVGLGDVAEED